MKKLNFLTLSLIVIQTLFSFHLNAQSNCSSITTNLEKVAQKHEKYGAITVLGNAEAPVRTMGTSKAHYQGMELMSKAVTAYMRTNLKDQLSFTNEAQQDRFSIQLLGKEEKGSTSIAGQQYDTSYSSMDLTLHGVFEVMSNECESETGRSTNYYKLLAMSPEGIIKTIEEAIASFVEMDEASDEALLNSWRESALKASLMEQQKKYEKNMN